MRSVCSQARYHALPKEEGPDFGGLIRVMNKRQEFLWDTKDL
jgi:hypothetical protein